MLPSHRIAALPVSLTAAIALCGVAGAAPPAEVTGLEWCAGSSACLTWDADPAAASYTVYRGDGADLAGLIDGAADSSYAGVFQSNTTGEMLTGVPPAGTLYWYLATSANADGESPAGHLRQLDPAGTSCGDRAYIEDFAGRPDGAAWPAPWVPAGSVDVADIQDEAARFRPTVSFYSLARLRAPLLPIGESDVEVLFTFAFEDTATQGVGFYVRSNGGYLNQTFPTGQGYAVFVEGFRQDPGIGLWKETGGTEEPLLIDFDPALGFQDGVRYRVRFRVNQNGPAETMLQARAWPEGSPEPGGWQVQISDATAGVLQGVRGGLALDSWSSINPNTPGSPAPQHTLVDDIEVVRLCNPLSGMTPAEAVEETFAFTEGPLWHDGELLFTDLDLDTIFSYADTGPATAWRQPSGGANGLAHDAQGRVLAAEQGARRISRSDAGGAVATVVDAYQGQRFNSPNDLVARRDGTLYFTDPPYGLAAPGDRELPFNGLFRLAPDGTLVAEWAGDATASGPNGVALAPDQDVLYVADSEAGSVTRWQVAGDGSLSAPTAFASGLVIPDGMTVDRHGNLYVATWDSTVEVFAPDGTRWGTIRVPRQATNCAFGGADRHTLWITAHEGLYRVRLALPGL